MFLKFLVRRGGQKVEISVRIVKKTFTERCDMMTTAEIMQIHNLRAQGFGYKKISTELGLSLNTVKSFCKRNQLRIFLTKQIQVFADNAENRSGVCLAEKPSSIALTSAACCGGTIIVVM